MEELFMRWWLGSKCMQVVRLWRQEQTARDAWNAGVAAEREACAVAAENLSTSDAYEIAHIIRQRSNI